MSVGFEALPRQRDCAKWLVLLPRVFAPVYLCAPCCCCVCMHVCTTASVCLCVCVCVCVCSPLSSLFRGMHTLADYGGVHACVKQIQNLVKKIKILLIK